MHIWNLGFDSRLASRRLGRWRHVRNQCAGVKRLGVLMSVQENDPQGKAQLSAFITVINKGPGLLRGPVDR
jgi:hypothetical protein